MTNAFGRGLIKLSDEGTFKAVKKLYVKTGEWRDAKTAWVKQNGAWIQVYPTPQGQITFDPPTLDFEATSGYESPTQFVSITNTGDENVIIEDFSVSYTASGKFVTFFDLEELGGQLPATIAPGETKRLGIAIDAGSGSAFVEQEVVVMVDTPTLKVVNILCPLTSIDVDYLVVAGGGGGGAGILGASYVLGSGFAGTVRAGGGGGGGVVVGYKRSVKRGETVQIKVGQGGAGGNASNGRVPGADGGNSSFGDIVAIGGGGGVATSGVAGRPGGSGGGAARAIFGTNRGAAGGAGTPGQGYPGGSSNNIRATSSGYTGADEGGGGGAGGPGSISGGPGRVSTITGTRQYYGGGGGGTSGGGGVGGGGAGGTSATANTGGGGGGGLIPYSYGKVTRPNGGDGGSGIVVIKYEYDVQLGQGGTVTTYTTDAGIKNWVHTFTQDGAFTYNEVLEEKRFTVIEQVETVTKQLGLSNAGEFGSSDSTIRIKTNVGAFGTQYRDYTIYGNVVPPYAEIDVWPKVDINFDYFRYNPRQTRQEVKLNNIGTGSLIITSVESNNSQYFKIVSYPDAVAPQQYGTVVIESRVTDTTPPGIYTDVVTVKSNNVKGDILLNLTLNVIFPEGYAKISTAGAGQWVVPEGVYRLSEVRVIGAGGGGGQGFNQQFVPRIPNPNTNIVVEYVITGVGSIKTSSGSFSTSGTTTVSKGELVPVIVRPNGSSRVVLTYQNADRIGRGGTVTSYVAGGLTYWVHTFLSTSSFSYGGRDPVLFGGIGTETIIVPGAGAGGGGGSGSIVSVANIEVIAGEAIEYVVGAGGAGVDPILSTTNPAPSGKSGQGTSFRNGLIAASGGLGGGGGGPNTGGVGAGSLPNPRVNGAPLVPRTLSYAWSGHMNTYAVWDNPSNAANTWYTVRKFIPTETDSYTFHLSCDNYGVLYLNGTGIISTTSFSSVNSTTVYIQKETINIIGMYAQNWGGPCGYALHVTNSAGRVVWDTRTYRAAETIESLPGAVSRRGGAGQNGTAGIGDGGHGGSNTFGLGGEGGLITLSTAAVTPFRTPGTGNFVVPPEIYVLELSVSGGGGGGGGGDAQGGSSGYSGHLITQRIEVIPGDVISVDVGGGGGAGVYSAGGGAGSGGSSASGYNGGNGANAGPSGLSGGGGGGGAATVVRKNGTIIIVAAGGGGGGGGGRNGGGRGRSGTVLNTTTAGLPGASLSGDGGGGGGGGGGVNGGGGGQPGPGDTGGYAGVDGTDTGGTNTGGGSSGGGGGGYAGAGRAGENGYVLISHKILGLSANGNDGRGPGTGGGGGASGVDGKITPASGNGADGEIYIAWGPIPPRDPPPYLVAHFVVSIDEQRMYDRVLPYCNPYVMQTSGFFTEKSRPYALFNGTANNYIGTPADPKLDLVKAANLSFTIEAWVILRGAGQYPFYGGIIVNRDAEYEVAISQNDQVIVAIDWGVGTDVNLPGSGWIIPPAGVAVVPRNNPTHIAVVANQNTLLIYINGTLAYTTGLNRVARRDNTPVWIGNRPGQSQGFNGGISDVRIWNVARTQAEIQANIQALVYNTPQGI
jgi:hypothetical protein